MNSVIIKRLLGLLITAGLIWLVWWFWNETPGWLRGTVFAEYSYLSSFLLIIATLSVLDLVINRLWKGKDH